MNQRNIDDNHYMSEDGYVCNKGRTEAYILTIDSLNIYGPKQYKFGDSDKNYYFISKSNAEVYREQLINYYTQIEMLKDNPLKSKKLLKRKKKVVLPFKPEFKKVEEVLNISQQVLKIKSIVGFKKWLKENGLKFDIIITNYKQHVEISINKNNIYLPIIHLKADLKPLPKCCGGKEFCFHFGAVNTQVLSGFNMDHWRILAKYFAKNFDEKLKDNSFGWIGEYYISYIKRPGNFEEPSARWGEILNKSKYFKKVGNFNNRNTRTNLDVYVSTQTYVNLYNE